MQIVKPLALAFSLLAFVAASAFADDAKKNQTGSQAKPSMSQSDSKSTQSATKPSGSASAGASSSTRSTGAQRLDFDKADKNKDGQLSRAEFDAMLKGQSTASAGASTMPEKSKSSSGTK